MSTDEKLTIWSEGFERVLAKEAEQSESLYWLHNKSSILATQHNDFLQIPSIILQTITGFMSATTGIVPPLALGACSIFTGVLSTLLSYYKFSAKSESHRLVSQLYLKIYKKLEIELSLPIAQRAEPQILLNDIREKMARISEVAPEIPESVITLYKKQFKNNNTSKPIIANGLDAIEIYKEPVLPLSPRTPKIEISYGRPASMTG
jgi:hypothetical protein